MKIRSAGSGVRATSFVLIACVVAWLIPADISRAQVVTVAGVQGIQVGSTLGNASGGYLVFNELSGTWGLYNPAIGGSLLTGTVPLSELSPNSLSTVLGAAGGGPHPVCVAWMQMNTPRPPPPPCYEPSFTPFGDVVGICTQSTYCLGQSAPALGGGLFQTLGMAAGILGIVSGVQTLTGALGGGGGGGGTYYSPTGCVAPASVTANNTCVSTAFQTGGGLLALTSSTTISIQPNLPSDLISALNNPNPTPVSSFFSNLASGSATSSDVSLLLTSVTSAPAQTPGGPVQQANFAGNVRLNPGATVFANTRYQLTEIAAFYGENPTTTAEAWQSSTERLCSSRPWSGHALLASFVPSSVFDGLCDKVGY